MNIIIDCRNTYINDNALSVFTSAFWQEIAGLKYDHTFIFITDDENDDRFSGKNVQIQHVKKTGIKWFDQKKLDKKLVTWQADRFIDILQTGFVVHRLLQGNKIKNTTAPANTSIFFYTNGEQQLLKPTTVSGSLTMVHPALAVNPSLSWPEEESLKTQCTGGRSFFLFTGNIAAPHQLMDLLKAFSSFKKWQQSNMQLVIAGYTSAWTATLEEKLLTYKYRADVVIIKNPDLTTIAKLAAACYAMLYPAAEDVFPFALLWAACSKKAVIASDTLVNRAALQSAEWIDSKNTAAGFAEAMVLLYKDEKHQQQLAQQLSVEAEQHSRNSMLTEVWQCIEK